ncbi:hypothetical protein LLH00_07615 [bacterium]|nr:hypothetical protein [bacterium]
MVERPAAGSSPRRALSAVLEDVLVELCRAGGDTAPRPTKDSLLEYLNSGQKRLNLILLRRLPPEQVNLLRRSAEFQARLQDALRREVIALKAPLLNPTRVRSLAASAAQASLAEARRDPDLWAARLLARLPLPVEPLPLLALRDLAERCQSALEARLPELDRLEELDAAFGFIQRELERTPSLEPFLRRALALAASVRDPGDLTAYHHLLAVRVPDLLERLAPSPEKDRALLVLREEAGTMDTAALRLEFARRALRLADSLMDATNDYEDLLELRFFFSQIGERANRKLLSKKTGRVVRELDFKTQGYRLLASLDTAELEDESLIEVVPVVLAHAERFVLGAPLRYLDLLMKFYLKTAVPLVRRLRENQELTPRFIQNFKRQVGLLNLYRDLEHLAEVFQRKMVLAICNPRMLQEHPEAILGRLTRLPPEFFPPAVMAALRRMIRERGTESRFTAVDVLALLAVYPPPESEEETGPSRPSPAEGKKGAGKK